MRQSLCSRVGLVAVLVVVPLLTCRSAAAQSPPPQWDGVAPARLTEDLYRLHTAEQPSIVVRVLARGLSHPWSFAFLPDGDVLVTEREGRLRIIRNGVLDPTPIAGVPAVSTAGALMGLLDVVLHPQFAQNRYVYLTYRTVGEGRVALARAEFDGVALQDLEVLWESKGTPFTTASGSRILFAPDGTLFLSVGGAPDPAGSADPARNGMRAQDAQDHSGKILRLRDDGTPPPDNPFIGREGHLPDLYSIGHRNPMGFAFHPQTGDLWAAEYGPQGGDEVNVILPGRNYGWPLVSFGRDYPGPRVAERWWREGMEMPEVVWLPSVSPSGMTFYTGSRFPAWRGNLFVAALMVGRIERTGRIERIVFNDAGQEIRRESILTELGQRMRDVRQGPDGLIYVITDEDDGALLRIEPVE
jgi:aldose sugar dehydrogenase